MIPAWEFWGKWALAIYIICWACLFVSITGMLAFAFWPEKKRYRVVEHEKTDWGTMFAIISPKGEIVGLDRYVVAKQRCAALNRQP